MSAIAISPGEELAQMEHRLGSKAAIGRVIRRDPAVVSRWMTKKSRLNSASRALVDGAYAVVMCLSDRGYEEADLEAVLTRPWAGLDDQAPAEFISRCDVAPILDAINSPTDEERNLVETPDEEIATRLLAAAQAEPISLDPRLSGFLGYPEATAAQVNRFGDAEPSLPEPRGRVRGVVHEHAIAW